MLFRKRLILLLIVASFFSFFTKSQNIFRLNFKLKAQEANIVRFQPIPIPLSDPEIINPMRGYYKWRGQEIINDSGITPSYDAYERYTWRQIESSDGTGYDFSVLERDIQRAFQEGRKFAFRLRDLSSDSISVPEYMKSYGWWYNGQFIPDWNSPYYQQRARNFVLAVGQRYNADPRIAFIDLGMYGRWGEWHVWNIDYNRAPAGITKATTETLKKIIDWHVEAFTNTRLVMLWEAGGKADVLEYALNHPGARLPVGIRNDCLGTLDGKEHFRSMVDEPHWSYIKERWRIAPMVTEYCGTGTGDRGFFVSVDQVKDFHVSMLSNGNFVSDWNEFTLEEKNNAILAGKLSGYRFQLNSLSINSQIAPGSSFDIFSSWSNIGVAPAYEKWNVVGQLKNPTTRNIAWQGSLSLDLEKFLPTKDQATGIDTPITIADTFSLPSSVLPGSYDLVVAVIDPAKYRKPLALAIRGKEVTDGSYKLGTIRVETGVSRPTSLPMSPTSWPTQASCPRKTDGDGNCDGSIGGIDYSIWLNSQCRRSATQTCARTDADFNGDGNIDDSDYLIWFNHRGT